MHYNILKSKTRIAWLRSLAVNLIRELFHELLASKHTKSFNSVYERLRMGSNGIFLHLYARNLEIS